MSLPAWDELLRASHFVEKPLPEKIECTMPTLNAIKRTTVPDAPISWQPQASWGVPIIAVGSDEVPDGKVRITYTNGAVEVFP